MLKSKRFESSRNNIFSFKTIKLVQNKCIMFKWLSLVCCVNDVTRLYGEYYFAFDSIFANWMTHVLLIVLSVLRIFMSAHFVAITVCGWCVQFCKINLCLFIVIRNVAMSYTHILSCLYPRLCNLTFFMKSWYMLILRTHISLFVIVYLPWTLIHKHTHCPASISIPFSKYYT